jgi:hypothetical protein
MNSASKSLRRVILGIAFLLAANLLPASIGLCEAGDAPAQPNSTNQAGRSPKKPLKSGPKSGTKVNSFFVRAVTGPHRNRSLCYVCRFGSRPVVMVLLQGVDKNVPDLFKALDKVLDAKRATGLRGFGVLVTDSSAKAVPILQTMAFDEKLRIPLTAATTAVAGPSCHNLNEAAATTIVFYRQQRTLETMGFRKGELNDAAIKRVLASIEELLKQE